MSLFEQLKRANGLLAKINEVLRKKLEEINQLRHIEEKLCQKLDEKPIEFGPQGKESLLNRSSSTLCPSSVDDLPYDQRQEILEKHIEDLQTLQVSSSV